MSPFGIFVKIDLLASLNVLLSSMYYMCIYIFNIYYITLHRLHKSDSVIKHKLSFL